jgi:hypothetical protein
MKPSLDTAACWTSRNASLRGVWDGWVGLGWAGGRGEGRRSFEADLRSRGAGASPGVPPRACRPPASGPAPPLAAAPRRVEVAALREAYAQAVGGVRVGGVGRQHGAVQRLGLGGSGGDVVWERGGERASAAGRCFAGRRQGPRRGRLAARPSRARSPLWRPHLGDVCPGLGARLGRAALGDGAQVEVCQQQLGVGVGGAWRSGGGGGAARVKRGPQAAMLARNQRTHMRGARGPLAARPRPPAPCPPHPARPWRRPPRRWPWRPPPAAGSPRRPSWLHRTRCGRAVGGRGLSGLMCGWVVAARQGGVGGGGEPSAGAPGPRRRARRAGRSPRLKVQRRQ